MQALIKKIKGLLGSEIERSASLTRDEISTLKMSVGSLLSQQNQYLRKDEILNDITKAEFKVYSQWGDDGIINFLVSYLDIPTKNFVEFGVENYTECNTRFLLINNNWSGLIIDGSDTNISSVKLDDIYWRYDLTAINSFVTAENINQLLSVNNFKNDLGLLHIDIDGNDYWVWDSINVVNPIIVIVEYNSIFGFDNPWTIPYDPGFVRSEKHYSNLYYGASLLSLCDLANIKGYSFIGCNSNGNNAYFIRKDKLKDLVVKTPKEGYVLSKFSESRDREGKLTFLKNEKRLELLEGLPVFNTRTNQLEVIK